MTENIKKTEISTWFERDRAHVCLNNAVTGDTIVEWWDEAVSEAVADGYLNASNWHDSAFAYAEEHGLLNAGAAPVSHAPVPQGWVGAHPELGVYCGWKKGGDPVWSSDTDNESALNGAYTFSSEEEARSLFETDGIQDGMFAEADMDIVREGMRKPDRASFSSCEAAGISTFRNTSPCP